MPPTEPAMRRPSGGGTGFAQGKGSRLLFDVYGVVASGVHHAPANHGFINARVLDLVGRNGKDVAIENDVIGVFARRQRTQHLVLKSRIGRTHGVGVNSFLDAQFLLRKPAVWIFSIEGFTGDGAI